ncbi:MAG: baseplate J/gp47 family protein [Candidatus Levybacteria bacterium]|nr:baseplate J/gp47 family protein [Candidatus Levybacteria bacterium]
MNLPFLRKKEEKEYFLTLLLRDEKVTAVIFEKITGVVRIIGKKEAYVNNLETATLEEWLEVLDKAISGAESALPEGIETQETIFGIKENWVEETKIKKEYLIKLKKTSDALGLIPIGFLIINEAIAHLLQQEEGAPVSGILVEIGQKNIIVSLLRAGRIIEAKRTKIEDDAAKITDRLLHHFTSYEVLPSRIIVLSDKDDNETLSQTFIGHSWSKSLPFLHVPQITLLPKGFDIRAILFGAASQMGLEMLPQEKNATEEELSTEENAPTPQPQEEEKEEEFGFIKEEDIKKTSGKADSLKIHYATKQHQKLITTIWKMVFSAAKKIFAAVRLLRFPTFTRSYDQPPRKKILLFIPPALVFLAIVILLSYVFFLKATITLVVKPEVIEQKQAVTFSSVTPTDVGKKIIAAQIVNVEEEGKITKPATGKKDLGEKAKGNITIYSNLTNEQTFSKGTVLTATNKLEFLLDQTVKVASVSGASDGQKTVKAAVIAKDIGKEFNLPSGVKFTLSSFNAASVEAKNEEAFSGGTKKEVSVVSKKDVEDAVSELTKQLEEKAKKDLEGKIDSKTKLFPLITNAKFSQKNISNKIDEEAKSFTLAGSVTYENLSYQENDLRKLAKDLLKEKGNRLGVLDDISYQVENEQKKNDGEATGIIRAQTFLLPKFEKEKIGKQVEGKSFDDAQNTLKRLPQVVSARIKLSPNLPLLPKLLPKLSRNITIIVEKE